MESCRVCLQFCWSTWCLQLPAWNRSAHSWQLFQVSFMHSAQCQHQNWCKTNAGTMRSPSFVEGCHWVNISTQHCTRQQYLLPGSWVHLYRWTRCLQLPKTRQAKDSQCTSQWERREYEYCDRQPTKTTKQTADSLTILLSTTSTRLHSTSVKQAICFSLEQHDLHWYWSHVVSFCSLA